MGYYIISKIELEGENNLKSTDVGYTSDVDIVNKINELYDSSLGLFLGENRTKLELNLVSVSSFFSESAYVNEARTQVNNIEELSLSEITNINQL